MLSASSKTSTHVVFEAHDNLLTHNQVTQMKVPTMKVQVHVPQQILC